MAGESPSFVPPEAVEGEEETRLPADLASSTETETATDTDSIAVQGREFSRGDRVTIRRGLSDGRPSDENDWTIDGISVNGRVVVRRPKKNGIDDVLTFAPDEFVSWQATTTADPVQPDAARDTLPTPSASTEPPVPDSPASAEVKRSAEAEQRIRSLDAVIDQYAAGASSAALQAENKYSSELAGRGIRGIFKGFGRRLVTKALIGGGIGAAFGGVVGAGAGVLGAVGSEAGVLGMRALRYAGGKMREMMGNPDELQRLEQMEAEKQNALGEIAMRTIMAREDGNTAEADRLRLKFLDFSSRMSDPNDLMNQATAELEQRYRGRKKWADLGWGVAEAGASLAGGLLTGNAVIQAFSDHLKARIAEAGFTMGKGGEGIGVLANHAEGLKQMQALGHHVHQMHDGGLVFNYHGGEAGLVQQAINNTTGGPDNITWAWKLIKDGGQLAHEASGLAGEFGQLVAKKFTERVIEILSGIGLASLVGDAVGRRQRPQQESSLDWLKHQGGALRNDLQGGGTPPDGPEGPNGPDDPNPDKKERIPIGSTWELQPGDLAEIVKNKTGRELSPNCKFKVTRQDEDGKVSLVIVDNDVEGNPVMVENTDTGGESLLGWEGEHALPVDYFLANFRLAVETESEAEEEDDSLDWEEVEEAGELPLLVHTGDEYEIDDPENPGEKKKVTVTLIEKGTPRKPEEEDIDSAEEEPAEPKFKLTLADEAGNSRTTAAMTMTELNDSFLSQDEAGRAAFIQELFKAEEEEEEGDEGGDEEEAEPASGTVGEGAEETTKPRPEGEEARSAAEGVSDEHTPASEGLTDEEKQEKLARVREIFGDSFSIDVQLGEDRSISLTDHPVAVDINKKVGKLGLKGWSGKITNRDRIPTGTPVSLRIRIGEDNSRIVQNRGESIAEVDMVVASFGEDKRITENRVSEGWSRGGFFFPVGDEEHVVFDRFEIESKNGRVIVRDAQNKLFGVHDAMRRGGRDEIEVFELDPNTLRPISGENTSISINELSDWYVSTGAKTSEPAVERETVEEPATDAPAQPEPGAEEVVESPEPAGGTPAEGLSEDVPLTEEAPIIGQSAESRDNGKTLRLRLNRDNPNEYIDLIRKDPITYRLQSGTPIVLTITSAIPQADGQSVEFIFKNQKGASSTTILTLNQLNKILSDPANAALVSARKGEGGG